MYQQFAPRLRSTTREADTQEICFTNGIHPGYLFTSSSQTRPADHSESKTEAKDNQKQPMPYLILGTKNINGLWWVKRKRDWEMAD